MQDINADLREVVQFHGHLCPGLALGYRVAKAALRELKADRPQDEELVAVVENDSCAADAIQFITGCTFGKETLSFAITASTCIRSTIAALGRVCAYQRTFAGSRGISGSPTSKRGRKRGKMYPLIGSCI
jgi:formylmethanofuran dehydrogenase subunit E-like metal-binding protein